MLATGKTEWETFRAVVEGVLRLARQTDQAEAQAAAGRPATTSGSTTNAADGAEAVRPVGTPWLADATGSRRRPRHAARPGRNVPSPWSHDRSARRRTADRCLTQRTARTEPAMASIPIAIDQLVEEAVSRLGDRRDRWFQLQMPSFQTIGCASITRNSSTRRTPALRDPEVSAIARHDLGERRRSPHGVLLRLPWSSPSASKASVASARLSRASAIRSALRATGPGQGAAQLGQVGLDRVSSSSGHGYQYGETRRLTSGVSTELSLMPRRTPGGCRTDEEADVRDHHQREADLLRDRCTPSGQIRAVQVVLDVAARVHAPRRPRRRKYFSVAGQWAAEVEDDDADVPDARSPGEPRSACGQRQARKPPITKNSRKAPCTHHHHVGEQPVDHGGYFQGRDLRVRRGTVTGRGAGHAPGGSRPSAARPRPPSRCAT